jgi:hypothetical protein
MSRSTLGDLGSIFCAEERSFHIGRTYADRRRAGVARTGLMPSCRWARLGDRALNRRSEFFGD